MFRKKKDNKKNKKPNEQKHKNSKNKQIKHKIKKHINLIKHLWFVKRRYFHKTSGLVGQAFLQRKK